MQGVDEVLDVKTALAEVENFQHQREERNAEQHHRRDVVPECLAQEFDVVPVRSDLFQDALF